MFFYRSSVGLFWIKPSNDKRWTLGVDNETLGSYYTPQAAADDVYVHVTGCSAWDMLDGKVDGPTDLSEWSRTP